jgi:Protein of unknown function (DUF2934)
MATRRTSDATRRAKSAGASAPVPTPTPTQSASTESAQAKPAAPKPAPRKRAPKAGGAQAPAAKASVRPHVTAEERRAMIAESAYLRAERRGFAPGHEVEDWCAAEREVDALLKAAPTAAQ